MDVIQSHRVEQLLEGSIVLEESDLTPDDLRRATLLLLLDCFLKPYRDQFHSFENEVLGIQAFTPDILPCCGLRFE